MRNFFRSQHCIISCYIFLFLCHANSCQHFQLHCLEAGTYICSQVLQHFPKCCATGNSCCHQPELQWLSTSVGNHLLSVKILFLILSIAESKDEQYTATPKPAMGGQGAPWLPTFPNSPVGRAAVSLCSHSWLPRLVRVVALF